MITYVHISSISLNLNLYCKIAFFDWFQLTLFLYILFNLKPQLKKPNELYIKYIALLLSITTTTQTYKNICHRLYKPFESTH
jgi:hypothetical protein